MQGFCWGKQGCVEASFCVCDLWCVSTTIYIVVDVQKKRPKKTWVPKESVIILSRLGDSIIQFQVSFVQPEGSACHKCYVRTYVQTTTYLRTYQNLVFMTEGACLERGQKGFFTVFYWVIATTVRFAVGSGDLYLDCQPKIESNFS